MIEDWLQSKPSVQLGHWPTPLEPLKRLSNELQGATLWLKRDDCSGLATGGNKTRKLEFLIGDALVQGADTVVTFGAIQSNHARQTAAACAKVGLTCHLVLSRRVEHHNPEYEHGGNVLLDRMLGAQLHLIDPADTHDYYRSLRATLEAQGRRVYAIPSGGSNALGALGYSRCAAEIAEQCSALGISPKAVIHASASAGTQAGLIYGFAKLGIDMPVIGINVFHPDPDTLRKAIANLLDDMRNADLDTSTSVPPRDLSDHIDINHAYFGGAYGRANEETLAAIALTAELEGVLFDPVYSGKALCAAIDQITIGNYRSGEDVLLVHTGGQSALSVYAKQLLEGKPAPISN